MKTMAMAWLLAAAAGAQAGTLEFTGEAERFMPDMVSRESNETIATTNALYPIVVWGCEDCPNQVGTDLFMALQRNGTWSGPGRVSVSRPHNESLPAFSNDGYWLYYLSDRNGGFGGLDLYRVYFSPNRETFASPENLGAGINSAGDEGAASVDTRTDSTYFASRGRKGAKGWDLFVSRRVNGRMTPGERLAGIDTAADEFDPALLADDAGLVFARAKKAGETPSTLWFAPREGDGFGKPVELGPAVNAPGASVRGPQQDWREPGFLLLSRNGDIFRIPYRVVE